MMVDLKSLLQKVGSARGDFSVLHPTEACSLKKEVKSNLTSYLVLNADI
jgi:hypothetical protein